MDLSRAAYKVLKRVKADSPMLLKAGAIAGVVLTAVVTARVAPKAADILAEKKKDLQETPREDKETRRIVYLEGTKKLAPLVLPVILTAGATIACICGLDSVHTKRYAAATAAYAIAKQSLDEWREKTREIVGPKKTEEIKTAIYEDNAKREPTSIVHTGCGDYPILDTYTGVLFYSDNTKVDGIVNDLQRDLNNGLDWVCINDIYAPLGIRPTEVGRQLGWNMGEKIDIDYGYGCDNDGRPCMVMRYTPGPRKDFWGDLRQ